MPKRFTATEKWQDKWFRHLEVKYKLLWLYMLDACSHAGIWEADLELASLYTGYDYDESEVKSTFSDRIQIISIDKWFIPKFIFFQYGKLHTGSSIHNSVLKILDKYGLTQGYRTLEEEYSNSDVTTMDMVQDKDKDIIAKNVPKIEKEKFGDDVLLTKEEYEKLFQKLGTQARVNNCISILDNYKGSHGRKYKSDYKAILNWVIMELEKRESKNIEISTKKLKRVGQ